MKEITDSMFFFLCHNKFHEYLSVPLFLRKIRCLSVREIYEMCQLAGCPQVCDIFRDSASSRGASQTFVNPAVELNLDIFIRERGEDTLQNMWKELLFNQRNETFQQETKLLGTLSKPQKEKYVFFLLKI